MFLLGQIGKFVTESKVQGEQRNAETNNSSASGHPKRHYFYAT